MWPGIKGKEGKLSSIISHLRWIALAIFIYLFFFIYLNSSTCLHIGKYQWKCENQEDIWSELYRHHTTSLTGQHHPDVPSKWLHLGTTFFWHTAQHHFSQQSSDGCGLRKDFSDILFLQFLRLLHAAWDLSELCKMRLYAGSGRVFQKVLISHRQDTEVLLPSAEGPASFIWPRWHHNVS